MMLSCEGFEIRKLLTLAEHELVERAGSENRRATKMKRLSCNLESLEIEEQSGMITQLPAAARRPVVFKFFLS